MIELALLVIVVAVVVLALRKRGAPGQPLIVQRSGRYHITFAPQLGSLREFLEAVAQRLAGGPHPAGNVPSRYFQLRRAGQAESFCSLAVAFRSGIYFIQAIVPRPLQRDERHLADLREFSEAVLLHYPLLPPVDEGGAEMIDVAVEEVARREGIAAGKLEA